MVPTSPPSARRRRVLRAALIALTLAGLAACGRKGEVIDLRPPPPAPPPPTPKKAPGTAG